MEQRPGAVEDVVMVEKRHIERLGLDLSPLGLGVMRLQEKNGLFSKEAFNLMDIAMASGVNYYDTAYFYNSGHSEAFLREALVKKYARDSFVIADKLPVWLCNSRNDMERIFDEQLERLGVEYIDIYLLHGMSKDRWHQVYRQDVLDFLEKKKREGRIRKTGFSFHDRCENIPIITEAYDWDIVYLQINYYDWIVQDVKKNYEYVFNKGTPIVVMEPVGGGRLVRLPSEAENSLKKINPNASIPSWAIRFCASLSGVDVVLSGMVTEAELRDNLSCFDPIVSLSDTEYAALENGARAIQKAGAIPCSACRYCTDDCPVDIDIPYIFQQFNDSKMFNHPLNWSYTEIMPIERRADKCINCGKCKEKCPQMIDIPKQLQIVHEYAFLIPVFHRNENVDTVMDELKGNSIVLFGAGIYGKAVLEYARRRKLPVSYFCDNSSHLWNTEIDGVKVIAPDKLKELYNTNDVRVLITSKYGYSAIKDQLRALGITPVNQTYEELNA